MRNSLLKQASAPVQYLWAEYPPRSGKVICERKDLLHTEWFQAMGLPSWGNEFDRVARGILQVNKDTKKAVIQTYQPDFAPREVWQYFSRKLPPDFTLDEEQYNPNYDQRFQRRSSSETYPPELNGLAAEARKCSTFEEFRGDFSHELKHGRYYHLTTDPNFTINPAKGPRDMSSMSGGGMSQGKLMITSHFDNWDSYYNWEDDETPKITRPYVAIIDMSQVPRNAYFQSSRGFGNEFWVDDPSKAKVEKVVPVEAARANDAHYHAVLSKYIRSDETLEKFYNWAKGNKTASPDFGYSEFNNREKDLKKLRFQEPALGIHLLEVEAVDPAKKAMERTQGYVTAEKMFLNRDELSYAVTHSNIEKEWKGTGLGQVLYDRMILQAKRRGADYLYSDVKPNNLSKDAEGAWKRLSERYPVEFDETMNRYRIPLKSQAKAASNLEGQAKFTLPSYDEFINQGNNRERVLNLAEDWDYYVQDIEDEGVDFGALSDAEQSRMIQEVAERVTRDKYDYACQEHKFPLIVYRSVYLKNGIADLWTEGAGESWTHDENSAERFLPGSDRIFILKAQIDDANSVDWNETLLLNMDTSLGDEENEVRLKFEAPIRLLAYRPKGKPNWVPLQKQITAKVANQEQVNTPAFKTWFGNSQVVDKQGNIEEGLTGKGSIYSIAWAAGSEEHEIRVLDGRKLTITGYKKPRTSEWLPPEENFKTVVASHKQTPMSDTTFPNMDKNDGEGSNAYALQPERVEGNSLMPSLEAMVPGAKTGDLEGDGQSSFFEEVENPHSVQPLRASFCKGASDEGTIRLYRGLEQPLDENFDLTKTDAPVGYSTWTDNPKLAREYAGAEGYVYQIDLPESELGTDMVDEDGERPLFLNTGKKVGLNGVSGDEYLVYQYHDSYSPSLIKTASSNDEERWGKWWVTPTGQFVPATGKPGGRFDGWKIHDGQIFGFKETGKFHTKSYVSDVQAALNAGYARVIIELDGTYIQFGPKAQAEKMAGRIIRELPLTVRKVDVEWDTPSHGYLRFSSLAEAEERFSGSGLSRMGAAKMSAFHTEIPADFAVFCKKHGGFEKLFGSIADWGGEDWNQYANFFDEEEQEQFDALLDSEKEKAMMRRAYDDWEQRYSEIWHTHTQWDWPMKVWRCITLKDINQLKTKGVGIYWAYEEGAAEAHWAGGGEPYTLEGQITENAVDWDGTVCANLSPSLGEDEKELRLKEGAPVKILRWQPPNAYGKWNNALPEWKRVTAGAGDTNVFIPRHHVEDPALHRDPSDPALDTEQGQWDAALPDHKVGFANPLLKKSYDDYEDVFDAHFDDEMTVAMDILDEYKRHKDDPNYRMRWDLVPAARLIKIWNDYMKTGFVRDEKGINMIAGIVLTNIAKLNVNTILCGHTQHDPVAYAQDLLGDDDEPLPEDYFDNDTAFFKDKNGSWLISDYALKPLSHLELQLRKAKTAEQKLQTIDKILNVIHMRSDLSSWFVQGGQATLNRLAGTGDDLTPGTPEAINRVDQKKPILY